MKKIYYCNICRKKIRFWSPKTYVTLDGRILCHECYKSETDANARLIAAAPDLLDALKALINRLYHNAQAFHELPEIMQNNLINNARKAIAKAEDKNIIKED